MTTQNDLAWESYITTKGIALDGTSYVVQATDLKKIANREPRLMAKFDSADELPRIFRQNNYSLIAISNGSYCLFRGGIFADVTPCPIRKQFNSQLTFPLLTSGRGYGESEYLDNAFNTGILSDFTQTDRLYLTIRGRERTKSFDFKVDPGGSTLTVDGAQIEVDGGFEGPRAIVLVEAKIGDREQFNIKQLYYPYRHFSDVVPGKAIRPVYFVYDLTTATYSFHEFVFDDPLVLNSIRPLRCCKYALVQHRAYRVDDLTDVRLETDFPTVPQADDLNKVLELLTLIHRGQNTPTEIADHFVFAERQSRYYAEAAEYLGLITRHPGPWELTQRGQDFLSTQPGEQQLLVAKIIINSWVFRRLIDQTHARGYFTKPDVEEIISTAQRRYGESVIDRRSRTILSWSKWLAEQIECFKMDGDKFLFA